MGWAVGKGRTGAATADSKGHPHVVPTGFNIDADKGVLEIGGHNLPDRGQKRLYLAHIRANPYAALVVDGTW